MSNFMLLKQQRCKLMDVVKKLNAKNSVVTPIQQQVLENLRVRLDFEEELLLSGPLSFEMAAKVYKS